MKIVILTEAGLDIGYGHLFRCLSLYDEVARRGFDVQIILHGEILDEQVVANRNIKYMNWIDNTRLETIIANQDYLIVDSYLANQSQLSEFSKFVYRVLYIDDTNRLRYPKGIIVNPSLSGEYLNYPLILNQKVYSGIEYIIIRDAFIKKYQQTTKAHHNKILIMLGGTDIGNTTESIITKLITFKTSYDYEVVIPRNKKRYYEGKFNHSNITFYTDLSAHQIAELMNSVDFAITGAGQSIFELIYLNVPFIAVQVIENQKYNVKAVEEYLSDKMVIKIEDSNFMNNLLEKVKIMTDKDYLDSIRRVMKQLIDGKGSKRIVDILLKEEIIVREAVESDIKPVFQLSNKRYVREYSINKQTIEWSDHVDWFTNALNNEDIKFYIITNKFSDFLGQIRFNKEELNTAIVSISLSEVIKGKGYAQEILIRGIRLFFEQNTTTSKLFAYISKENTPSLKLFTGLGFEILNNESLLKLVLQKEAFNDYK